MVKKVKKRKFRKEFIQLASIVCCVIVLCGIGVWAITNRSSHQSTKYSEKVNVEKSKKPVDKVFRWPSYKDQYLNSLIDNIMNEWKEGLGENVEALIDYESFELYDQYLHLLFWCEEGVGDEIIRQEKVLNYDLKEQKIIALQDVFRRDYSDVLERYQIIDTTFKIEESGIAFIYEDRIIEYEKEPQIIHLQHDKIPSYATTKIEVERERVIDPEKKMIAFSFDDGPLNLETHAMIVSALVEYDASATFFVIGEQAKDNTEVLQMLIKNGFHIGNHTYAHDLLLGDNIDEVLASIYKTQDVVYQATGVEPAYVRPVSGVVSGELQNRLMQPIALWTIDSQDWMSRDVDVIASTVLNHAYDGGVVVFHDIYESTANALKIILPQLIQQGYQIVSIEEMVLFRGRADGLE